MLSKLHGIPIVIKYDLSAIITGQIVDTRSVAIALLLTLTLWRPPEEVLRLVSQPLQIEFPLGSQDLVSQLDPRSHAVLL